MEAQDISKYFNLDGDNDGTENLFDDRLAERPYEEGGNEETASSQWFEEPSQLHGQKTLALSPIISSPEEFLQQTHRVDSEDFFEDPLLNDNQNLTEIQSDDDTAAQVKKVPSPKRTSNYVLKQGLKIPRWVRRKFLGMQNPYQKRHYSARVYLFLCFLDLEQLIESGKESFECIRSFYHSVFKKQLQKLKSGKDMPSVYQQKEIELCLSIEAFEMYFRGDIEDAFKHFYKVENGLVQKKKYEEAWNTYQKARAKKEM